jgi:hypothetical protein
VIGRRIRNAVQLRGVRRLWLPVVCFPLLGLLLFLGLLVLGLLAVGRALVPLCVVWLRVMRWLSVARSLRVPRPSMVRPRPVRLSGLGRWTAWLHAVS